MLLLWYSIAQSSTDLKKILPISVFAEIILHNTPVVVWTCC
ncbi:hypothetical protein [Phormidesmis priestleyi]|nr:hypothetical protein [Phormidesmis priestleyi]